LEFGIWNFELSSLFLKFGVCGFKNPNINPNFKPKVFLLIQGIFNYFCTLFFETQKTLPGLPKSIQQNIVNKSLEFQIIIIPLHPFLYQSGII
jgi:hypothetical protein